MAATPDIAFTTQSVTVTLTIHNYMAQDITNINVSLDSSLNNYFNITTTMPPTSTAIGGTSYIVSWTFTPIPFYSSISIFLTIKN